jgi:hypothetical protein
MLEIKVLGCGGPNNVWSKFGTKNDQAIWMFEIQVLDCGGPHNVWSKFGTKKYNDIWYWKSMYCLGIGTTLWRG